MNFGGINIGDTANGPGLRISLFVSGCTHHCEGCFNSETWNFDYGSPLTGKDKEDIFFSANLMSDYLQGFSLLGGEPFDRSYEGLQELIEIVTQLRKAHPQFDFWVWSGYTFEQLMENNSPRGELRRVLLSQFDVLVDGKFILPQKDITLKFRGSHNQRILNIPQSMSERKPVLQIV